MSPPRLVLPILLLLSLLAPAPASAGVEVDLDAAYEAVEGLKQTLKSSRTPSADVLAALDDVAAAWHGLRGPVPPHLVLVPEDADEEQHQAIGAENERLQAEYAKRVEAFEKEAATWRKKAAAQLLKALALRRRTRAAPQLREEVGVHAAKILGETGEKDLWKQIRKVFQTRVVRPKVEVSPLYLEALFEAVGRLGDPEALAWLAEEYVHTRASPPREVDKLVAAQRAFVLFDVNDVPGSLRHEIVRKMMTLYAATESVARQSSNDAGIQAVRIFWDRIRTGAIAAVQHLSGMPRNEDGEALATMEEFQEWFRDHKSVRRPPWTRAETPDAGP